MVRNATVDVRDTSEHVEATEAESNAGGPETGRPPAELFRLAGKIQVDPAVIDELIDYVSVKPDPFRAATVIRLTQAEQLTDAQSDRLGTLIQNFDRRQQLNLLHSLGADPRLSAEDFELAGLVRTVLGGEPPDRLISRGDLDLIGLAQAIQNKDQRRIRRVFTWRGHPRRALRESIATLPWLESVLAPFAPDRQRGIVDAFRDAGKEIKSFGPAAVIGAIVLVLVAAGVSAAFALSGDPAPKESPFPTPDESPAGVPPPAPVDFVTAFDQQITFLTADEANTARLRDATWVILPFPGAEAVERSLAGAIGPGATIRGPQAFEGPHPRGDTWIHNPSDVGVWFVDDSDGHAGAGTPEPVVVVSHDSDAQMLFARELYSRATWIAVSGEGYQGATVYTGPATTTEVLAEFDVLYRARELPEDSSADRLLRLAAAAVRDPVDKLLVVSRKAQVARLRAGTDDAATKESVRALMRLARVLHEDLSEAERRRLPIWAREFLSDISRIREYDPQETSYDRWRDGLQDSGSS